MVHAKVVVTWSMPLNEIVKVIGDEQPQIRAGTGGAYRTAIGFIIIISRARDESHATARTGESGDPGRIRESAVAYAGLTLIYAHVSYGYLPAHSNPSQSDRRGIEPRMNRNTLTW